MTADTAFEIFLIIVPGLESAACEEARAHGFRAKTVAGGVALRGGWRDVWRANLVLRGPSRILARLDSFPVHHLAQLDKRARRVPWSTVLRPDVPFKVEATAAKSRIYHSGAAAERIERAIAEEIGASQSDEAAVSVRVRIDNDVCTVAVDTSGDLLHKRGHKEAVNKAPMRETMAALFLRRCGYEGREPVIDPMCGSGTFVIEAAEIAAGLNPGRSRTFAFEHLATFDPDAWGQMRSESAVASVPFLFHGSDRDPGAIRMSAANAARAGVSHLTRFEERDIADVQAPDGDPGLVIVNPPYGDRIGDKAGLAAIYRTLGRTLTSRFKGWRVGLITSDESLAKATGLPFQRQDAPVLHGGLRIALYQTGPLP